MSKEINPAYASKLLVKIYPVSNKIRSLHHTTTDVPYSLGHIAFYFAIHSKTFIVS